uniref:Uncharacterized protein n=1 Tax=Plectus sambesii TaxID=2011161 RepID=A0A914V5T7_9BILA
MATDPPTPSNVPKPEPYEEPPPPYPGLADTANHVQPPPYSEPG